MSDDGLWTRGIQMSSNLLSGRYFTTVTVMLWLGYEKRKCSTPYRNHVLLVLGVLLSTVLLVRFNVAMCVSPLFYSLAAFQFLRFGTALAMACTTKFLNENRIVFV